MTAAAGLLILPVQGLPEVRPGDILAELIAAARVGATQAGRGVRATQAGRGVRATQAGAAALLDGDVVVVTSKIVSKAEGRLVDVDPADAAARLRLAEAEAVRVLRRRGELLVAETAHGFVCASAGVDLSNVGPGQAALLPLDADRSARRIRDGLRARAGVEVAVVVSDSFGRPWRRGVTDVALGCAGVAAVVDLRGTTDASGQVLVNTEVAVADELAAAAELVMGKAAGVPVAVVRGVDRAWLRESSVGEEIVRPSREDLFR